MTFRYVVTVDRELEPRGLVMWQWEDRRLDMLAWDWLDQRWRWAPDLVAPVLFGDVPSRVVPRPEAEAVAAQLGIPLPTEEEAMKLTDDSRKEAQRDLMHTFRGKGGTSFHHNSDLTDPVLIETPAGQLEVPGEDLVELVIEQFVRSKLISYIERVDLVALFNRLEQGG